MFDIVTQFAEKNYAHDPVLRQLIAVDYYLHFKVKPQPLFLDEIPRPDKIKLIEQLHLNHHKFRYVVLPLTFDYAVFLKDNRIQKGDHHFIAQYNGIQKAEVVFNINVSSSEVEN